MRWIALIGVLVASASAVDVLVGYHEAIGIPEAARIKAAEEDIFREYDANKGLNGPGGRIVGGVIAPTNAHPHLGGLIISFAHIAGNSVCGSSLVTTNRLLTAAHCWFDGTNQASLFTVVVGSQFLFFGDGSETRISTSTVVTHPQWTPSTLANDIAVIYLPSNVLVSQSIQPIALPSGTQLWDSFAGMWGLAAGYGKTTDAQVGVTTATQVSQVNLQVITVQACQAVFGHWALDSNICTNGAGGVGICGGDSGGPLIVNQNGQNILVGLSSFVAAAGCELGFPSAFVRVTSFHNFILQNIL